MQVSIESSKGLERQVKVTIPAEKVDSEVLQRLQKATKTVNIKGFRKGKVPLKVVQQQYGKAVRQEVMGEVVNSSFYEAIKQEDLKPVGQPKIEDIVDNAGQDLEQILHLLSARRDAEPDHALVRLGVHGHLLHAEARVEGPVGEAARLGLRVADRLEAHVLARQPAALRERVEQERLLELEPVRGLGLERVQVPLEARPVARLPLDAELVAQVRDADVPPERALAVRDDARAVPVDVGREPPVRDELAEHGRWHYALDGHGAKRGARSQRRLELRALWHDVATLVGSQVAQRLWR